MTTLRPALAFLIAATLATPAIADEDWTKPPPLRPGDVIRFVAPAGPADPDGVRRARELMEAKGFKVVVPESIGRRRGYLAGSDDERVAELNEALRDPNARGVFAVRGGYGLTRILDRVDYQAIREHPKIVVGYSDLTALHLAIGVKCRLVTFHGPMPLSNLKDESGDGAYAAHLFWNLLRTGRYAEDRTIGLTVPAPSPAETPGALTRGRTTGRLTGGNLSLIAATVGTPYQIETKGRIVFLEDTKEAAYRLDRMLSQLRLAGLLDEPAGVVLGSFDGTDPDELGEVLRDYFAGRPYPVMTGFPVGHIPHNAVLPYGVPAEIDSAAGTLRLRESPLAE